MLGHVVQNVQIKDDFCLVRMLEAMNQPHWWVEKLENHQYSEELKRQRFSKLNHTRCGYTQPLRGKELCEKTYDYRPPIHCSHSVSLAISLAFVWFCKIKLFKEINDWKHNACPCSFSSSLPSLISKSLFLSEFPFFSLSLFSTLNFSLPSYICCGVL